jgi:glyceraldehyde 3-phosphate dehydrogenase
MALEKTSENYNEGVLGFTEDLVVSQDFVGDSRTSIVDANANWLNSALQNHLLV